ncbi:MAG: hypothetical protein IK118_03890, partial [Clostridia bacterium]|nr:hypothetical protein [Clostridia bacterium]
VLSGGAAVAVIDGIIRLIMWYAQRRATKADRVEEKNDADLDGQLREIKETLDAQKKDLAAQSEALMFIMYDRIQYLGQAYIAAGEIDFDDRRRLNDMHHSYHYGLGGNGDLDVLMAAVNELPLKVK